VAPAKRLAKLLATTPRPEIDQQYQREQRQHGCSDGWPKQDSGYDHSQSNLGTENE
jgi:hypothetical protein